MAGTVNSEQKLQYAISVSNEFSRAKSALNRKLEDVRAKCDEIGLKPTDRIYNCLVTLVGAQFGAMDTTVLKISENIVDPLNQQSSLFGDEFRARVKKVSDDLKDVGVVKLTADPFTEAEINGRGGYENFTEATQSQFGEICKSVIDERVNVLNELLSITTKSKDGYMDDTYLGIGKKFEDFCNACVGDYNKTVGQIDGVNEILKQLLTVSESTAAELSSLNTDSVDTKVLDV